MTTSTTNDTIRIQGVGEMPAIPVHALEKGDRVMWNGGAIDVVERIEYTPSGKSADLTLRREGTGEENRRRVRSTRLVAIANIDEIRTRSESIPASPEAEEKPLPGTSGTEAPTAPSEAEETAPVAPEKAPRRRSRDVAATVESPTTGRAITVTARQLQFLRELARTPQYVEGAPALWTDVLIDEIGMGGSTFTNGMQVGAMVSTLREKGLVEVWSEGREDGMTGRVRRVKAMQFTPAGKVLMESIEA